MIFVSGIGWINKEEYGCIMKKMSASYKNRALPKKKIFSSSFRNFGRLDNLSRLTCSAVALALKDAGIDYPVNRKQDMGIISTGYSGSFQTDMLYFKDYLESGRTLSRGNLFIYTLPSSPAGEAAIHFGLRGPLLYVAGPAHSVETALTTASGIISSDRVPAILAGMSEDDYSLYFVLKNSASSRDSLCDLDQAITILSGDSSFDEKIKEFTHLKKG